jgi:hypothetical protein
MTMDSVMVFGAFALAAIFVAGFLLVSDMARRSRETAEDLQNEITLAHTQKKQLEAALAQTELEHARQGGQIEALQDRVRQHVEMNQSLRDALAEADTQGEELRKKFIAEVTRGHQLSDRLAGALLAMNDISQTIIDMAERHRKSVQMLLDPVGTPLEQPGEQFDQAVLPFVIQPLPGIHAAAANAPENGILADTASEQKPAHDRPMVLALVPQTMETAAALA